jgi:formylglycine-generating enzyme required for sulfatase activity
MRGSILPRLRFFPLSLLALALAPPAGLAQSMAPGAGFRDCPTCPLLVVVPAGNVASGDPNDYDDTEDDRAKRPRIVIAKPFAIGKYEVTQAEWEAVMGDNPSDHKGKDLPVVRVTWRQVQGFLDKLNAQTGRAYRLPGEAEWEYAARAGSPGAYAFGDDPAPIGQYGWYRDNSGERIQPVGRLKPNAFGLHDTHGNVWEWTADCAGGNYASNLPADFAKDWQNSCYRVIRGGSILNYPKTLTVFSKGQLTPVNFNMNLGFRVARSLP